MATVKPIEHNTFQLKAGAAIAINDAVEIGPDGKGYPVVCTDYAAVTNCTYGTAQTSAATGRIIAATTVWGGGGNSANSREPVCIDSYGKIWIVIPISAQAGMQVKVFSAKGNLDLSIPVASAAGTYEDKQAIVLSNGNILVSGKASTNFVYQIFSPLGESICSLTTLASIDSIYSVCSLSGGGFALLGRWSGDGVTWKLSTYSNAGVSVLAQTAVFTAATSTTTYPSMAQTSDGNLVIALYMSTYGLHSGVVTTGAFIVAAFAQLNATTSMTPTPAISILPGYFCIGYSNGLSSRAAVFSNAGVLQGSEFSVLSSGIGYYQSFDLTNDGIQFWFIAPDSTLAKEILVKIPTAGSGFVSTDVTTASANNYNKPLSCFYSNGKIVSITEISGDQFLWVASTATGLLVSSAETTISVTGSGQRNTGKILNAGDFSFIYFYFANATDTVLVAGKYANTSIAGVAASTAAANDYANMYQGAGTYPVNTLKGSPSAAFDHTTGANITGNKGTILTNGLVLRGM